MAAASGKERKAGDASVQASAEDLDEAPDRSRSPRTRQLRSGAGAEPEENEEGEDVVDDDAEDSEDYDDMEDDDCAELSLVDQAQACLEELPPRPARARELFEEALKAQPDKVEVLDAFGTFLCEEGEADRARELLLKSAELRPEESTEKYLYLAQMSSGSEALSFFSRGAEVLQKELDALLSSVGGASSSSSSAPAGPAGGSSEDGGDEVAAVKRAIAEAREKPLRRQLAGVRASIAELYMTDLCDLEDAEARCEEALGRGFEADVTCLELLTTKATLRKVQGRCDDARELTLEAARLVKAASGRRDNPSDDDEGDDDDDNDDDDEDVEGAAAGAAGVAGAPSSAGGATCAGGSSGGGGAGGRGGEKDEADEDFEEQALPDEDVVASLCRTMIDLEQTTEARQLLVGLLERDEEDLRAWVLLGWCHVVEEDPGTAQDCAKHGLKLCKKHGAAADSFRPELQKLLKRAQSAAGGSGGAKKG